MTINCTTCGRTILDLDSAESRRHLEQGGRLGHFVDEDGRPTCDGCLIAAQDAEVAARVERARGRALMRALAGPLAEEP